MRLTEKETAILRYLYRAGQKPVSRETLLQEVWGYNSGVTTHTLETHIYRLRQKVEKDAAAAADPGDGSRRLQAGAVRKILNAIPGRVTSAEGRRHASPESRGQTETLSITALDSGLTRRRALRAAACPGMTELEK